ncbi:MAG: beta-ketoacyl-ACP synthase II [Vampirovibrionales bacterium]|nr:beta-ketoacyl-ACP synthase II [Vampirovibrionales bacterium]
MAPDTLSKPRVVVTGMGAITPIGNSLDAIWSRVMSGESGIGYLSSILPEEMTCRIGGEIKDFCPEDYMDKKEARRMDRYMQFAMAATSLAFKDADLRVGDNIVAERLGVVLGSGAGGMGTMESQLKRAIQQGYHKVSPFFVPMMLPDSGAGRVSIAFKARGPNKAVITACSTGSDCIGEALRALQRGEADVMIAGGAEAPIYALAVAGFVSARALSQREDEPTRASRPFDKDRDGFVIAEGAGVLILETLEHAQARGAQIYAELSGYGCSSDANDIVAPCPDGDGAARAMIMALQDAGLTPEAIQYINAHGTSTPLGDVAETLAIKRVFGEYAKAGLMVSSTKSLHGHLLGGAGALEAILCILAMRHNIAPPTINLDHPDPQCDLDYVPHQPRPVDNLRAVMSNSFGFGGHNASLIFRKTDAAGVCG